MIEKSTNNQILAHFFTHPTTQFHMRELSRQTNFSMPTIVSATKLLEKQNLIHKTKIANLSLFQANRDNTTFLNLKRIHNLEQIFASGLITYIKHELSNPGIVLFGSFAKGEDVEESDIDLYIETPSKKQLNFIKYEKVLKRKIQVFQHKNLKELTNPHLANNIVNGTTLNHIIEVFT